MKLGVPSRVLLPFGIEYIMGYVRSGGAVLLLAGLTGFFSRYLRNWFGLMLIGQVAAQFLYVTRAGGDIFPYHRFLVPVIPMLAIAGGTGIFAAAERFVPKLSRFSPALVSFLAIFQLFNALASP